MTKRLLIITLSALFAVTCMPPVAVGAATTDLRSIFPGPHPVRYGWNYVVDAPSNLYYSRQPGGIIIQANDPTGCHFDSFRWTTSLRYDATTNRCNGEDHVSSFVPGIQLAPAAWNGKPWQRTGTSRVTTYRRGVVECTGQMTWTTRVVGWVEVTPGEQALYWSNDQRTQWLTGPCAPWITRWAEHMYYTRDGYRRSAGGNLDGGFSWDVWYIP